MFEEVYGKAAMKRKQTYKWHKRFSDDRASVSDDPCLNVSLPGLPTTGIDRLTSRMGNIKPRDGNASFKENKIVA
jgi:hypothetical protein